MEKKEKLKYVSPEARKLYETIISANGDKEVYKHFLHIDPNCFAYFKFDEVLSHFNKMTSWLNELIIVKLFSTYKVVISSIEQIDFVIEK